jgi:glycosyltransferase involved in cell wall biosynthesis
MAAVSVLMPAYNVDRYLDHAARSALVQTYRDLELIIVDDGSTDRTLDIAHQVQASDPARVRVVAAANGGPAAARNAAIAHSSGDYFALLDADDLWEPEFLARQMAVFAAMPDTDLVTGNGRNLRGERHGQLVHPCPDPRPDLNLATIIRDERAVFVMTVFRRRVVDAIGGFDSSLRGNEDFDYWMRAAIAGFRFRRNPEPLAWYRRRDDSLSSNTVRMLEGAILVCRKLRPLIGDCPERDLLDLQIEYYETEHEAARVRAALATRNLAAAAEALAALQARRPTLRTAVAGLLARHAGPLLGALYHWKQACRA